jgi:hypothetical protein
MIKSKLFFLSLLFVLAGHNTVAQKPELNSYVILTVEDSFSKGFEGVKKHYWIIETDSLKSSTSVFYPLLLSGFSKANFENCCKGVDIDPFVLTPADSVFDIGSGYFKESEYLDKLIFSKRKKAQQIVKEWAFKKNKELITFYITPIKGRFCNSGFAKTGQWRTGYNGKIFIPYSSFEVNLDFWNSAQLSILSNIDFANLKFDIVR